jgi:outer membrane lipoprotein-sorting protein
MAMRRLASLLLFALLTAGLGGAGQAAPRSAVAFSDADRADLDRVSAYLNSIHTMAGNFVQVGPDGQMDQGRIYLAKPGRLRFEYSPPSPIVIVSDGRTVAVGNTKLKTVDRYPLSATPLGLIVSDDIDLAQNPAILAVRHESGLLMIEARTTKNRTKANISLVFADPDLELRQWTVVDDQGLATTVALRGVEEGPVLSDTLFVLRDLKGAVGAKARD